MRRSSLIVGGSEMTPTEIRRITAALYAVIIGGPLIIIALGAWFSPERLTGAMELLRSCRGLPLDLGFLAMLAAVSFLPKLFAD